MFLLSGRFAATNTTIREGRAALPDFVFGVLADGGVSCGSEERGELGGVVKGTRANDCVTRLEMCPQVSVSLSGIFQVP